MLGGSVFTALLRFAISLAGTIILFSLMSEPRFDRKKAAAIAMYVCFAVFALCMNSDSIFLSLYKLALTFYLMAFFVVGGIEIAVIFLTVMSGRISLRE